MKTMRTCKLSLIALCFLIQFALIQTVASQGVAINTFGNPPDSSAMLDVNATNKGILIPRIALISTTVSAPVENPTNSLLLYNTASVNDVVPGFYYWDSLSTKWTPIKTSCNCPPADTNETLLNFNGCLYVKNTDEPGLKTYSNAVSACANLGSGWYLPNKMELDYMYLNWNKPMFGGTCFGGQCPLNGFSSIGYWSSTKTYDPALVWVYSFSSGEYVVIFINNNNKAVRCVRR